MLYGAVISHFVLHDLNEKYVKGKSLDKEYGILPIRQDTIRE